MVSLLYGRKNADRNTRRVKRKKVNSCELVVRVMGAMSSTFHNLHLLKQAMNIISAYI
jgi:hypothetical protein